MRQLAILAVLLFLWQLSFGGDTTIAPEIYNVGLAKVDITPTHPVRLNGFGGRKAEHDGVIQPIHAAAMAIEGKCDSPLILIAVDVLGIPAEIRTELAKRLKMKPERLCITATHTHSAPMLKG